MKKIITGMMIGIILFSLTACKKEETKTDASRFKEEYESLNGTKNSSGKTIREIEIGEDNPMIYQSTKDILKKMEDKETFVVYFGFAECPWCRSMLEQFLKSAKDNGIDSIYYVDVQEIRDTYQINDNGEVVETNPGVDGYKELIEKMKDVLADYTLTTENGEEVMVGEKRIYAPNVVAVVAGQPEKMVEGTSEKLEDPYSKLTDEMKEESYNSFKCLWECLQENTLSCKKNAC